MKKLNFAIVGALLALSGAAHAEGLGISANVSTLGLGLDVSKPVAESVNARVGFNVYNLSKNGTQDNVDYKFDMKLQNLHAMADWYPSEGAFRLTGGLLYNNSKVSLKASPSGAGTYTINNTVYTTTDVADMNANVTFNKIAPYIGIGFGNPVTKAKTWGFVADLGVVYQNSPSVSLNTTCGSTLNAAACAALQSDTATESGKLANSLDSFKWYPVLSVGASYQF